MYVEFFLLFVEINGEIGIIATVFLMLLYFLGAIKVYYAEFIKQFFSFWESHFQDSAFIFEVSFLMDLLLNLGCGREYFGVFVGFQVLIFRGLCLKFPSFMLMKWIMG